MAHVLPPPVPSSPDLSVVAWESLMRSSPGCDPASLKSVVMNWLVVAGYREVAEHFQQESGTQASVPLSSISTRTDVRESISRGAIATALSQLESISPTLLSSRPSLLLALRQQQLVELIRANQVPAAIEFARTHLRDECKDEAAFLSRLESIMSLLAFSALPADQNPMRHLLEQAQRNQLADRVNENILEAQFAFKESQLALVVKQMQHGQEALLQFVSDFPQIECDASGQPTRDHSQTTSTNGHTAASTGDSAALNSTPLPVLLDPTRYFESRAQTELATRRAAAEHEARTRPHTHARSRAHIAARAHLRAALSNRVASSTTHAPASVSASEYSEEEEEEDEGAEEESAEDDDEEEEEEEEESHHPPRVHE